MQIFVAAVVVLYKRVKENAKKNPMIGGIWWLGNYYELDS